jgi:hypothetical protein
MIGGSDYVIPTPAGKSALDACLKVIQRRWPEAVAQDALTATPLLPLDAVPGGQWTELFVYRDAVAAREWDRQEASPELIGTMVHLTFSDANVTVTVDDTPPAEIKAMVDEMSRVVSAGPSAGNGTVHSPGAVNPSS